jgi:hypothetical protein
MYQDLRPCGRKREGGAKFPRWQCHEQPHPISNSVLPGCGRSSKFSRQAVNVDQKSRLRFYPPKIRKLRLFYCVMLDASVSPEDADPLHFGTISVPQNAQYLIAVTLGGCETGDYIGCPEEFQEISTRWVEEPENWAGLVRFVTKT